MIRMKNFVGLLLGAVMATAFTSCAPVEAPSPQERNTSAGPDTPADAPMPAPRPLEAPRGGLQDRIELAIEQVRERQLLTTNGFWTVLHAILGLGPSVTMHDPQTGRQVNALQYICDGGDVRGMQFIPTKEGLDVRIGPTFVGQGHQDQFVAEMAQWQMPLDRKFVVNGKDYTFEDFVRHTQARARVTTDQELEWAMLLIGQYRGTDISWTNSSGEKLRFEDLVRHEVDAPLESAACGGTHRLFGLAWVYHLHLLKGGQTTGVWKDLVDQQAKYRNLARQWQNRDGSFSTNFFRGPGKDGDMQLRMNTTGHIFEWLSLSLSDAELKEPWVQDAANALAMMFQDIQGAPMEGGTMYHAVHGLLIYYSRVYDPAKLGANRPVVPLPPKG